MKKKLKTLLVFGAITVSVICISLIVSEYINRMEFTNKVEEYDALRGKYDALRGKYDAILTYDNYVLFPKIMELSDSIKKMKLSDSIKINHKKTCQYD